MCMLYVYNIKNTISAFALLGKDEDARIQNIKIQIFRSDYEVSLKSLRNYFGICFENILEIF